MKGMFINMTYEEEILSVGEESADDGQKDSDERSEGDNDADLRREYEELIKNKFKKFYTEDTQKMINRRFRKLKEAEERNSKLEEAAKELASKKEREAEVMNTLVTMGEAIKADLPGFSLDDEMRSPLFDRLAHFAAETGEITLAKAYELAHFEDTVKRAVKSGVETAQKVMLSDMRNRASRPSENGSARAVRLRKKDVSGLTKSERANIALRASKGDRIKF